MLNGRETKRICQKHGSTILTTLGVVEVIGTTVAAVKETSKALMLLNEAKKEKGEELTMRDYVYLNEWYEELGLDIVEDGHALGWSVGMCLARYWQNYR